MSVLDEALAKVEAAAARGETYITLPPEEYDAIADAVFTGEQLMPVTVGLLRGGEA